MVTEADWTTDIRTTNYFYRSKDATFWVCIITGSMFPVFRNSGHGHKRDLMTTIGEDRVKIYEIRSYVYIVFTHSSIAPVAENGDPLSTSIPS